MPLNHLPSKYPNLQQTKLSNKIKTLIKPLKIRIFLNVFLIIIMESKNQVY